MAFNYPGTIPSGYDGRMYGGYISNEVPRSYHRQPPSPEGSSDSSAGGEYIDPAPQIKVHTDNDAVLVLASGRPYHPMGGQSAPPFSGAPGYGQPAGPSGPLSLPSDIAGVHPMHMNPALYGGFGPTAMDFSSTFPPMNTLSAALEMHHPMMHSHSPGPSESETSWDSDQYSSPSPTGSNAALPLPSPEETEDYLRKTLEIPYPYPLNLSSLPDEPFDKKAPAIATLIKLAICGSKHKRLTLRQIYDEIEKRYPSWKDNKDKPWQRSIRHNLSLKAIFVRIERPVSHPGKGFYWTLDIRQGEGNKRDRKRRDQGGRGGSRRGEDDDDDYSDGGVDDDYSDGGVDDDVVMRGRHNPGGQSATRHRPSSSSTQGPGLVLLPGGHQAMRVPQEGAYGAQGYVHPQATFLDHHRAASGGSSSVGPSGVSPYGLPNHPLAPNVVGPHMRWEQRSPYPLGHPSSPANVQQMGSRPASSSGMYPGYVPPANVEHRSLRRTMVDTRHGYPSPSPMMMPAQMPMRQMTMGAGHAQIMPNVMPPSPDSRSRRPHSRTSPEEDEEERQRASSRPRTQ